MVLTLKESLPLSSFHFPQLSKSAITEDAAIIADAMTMN
jgi:hypothetical protein